MLRDGTGGVVVSSGLRALLKLRLPTSRAGFVLLMMSLLAAGVALTMWLSTQAIADSYRLQSLRTETGRLAERAERLQQDVTRQQTASSLARRARALGMVPSSDPARILVRPNGKTKLFGDPEKAKPLPSPAPATEPDEPASERDRQAGRERESSAEQPDRRDDTNSGDQRHQVRAAGDASTDDEAAGGQ
ncbi:MAG: hypothetical protein ACRDSE_18500 [Pseudonocardiaceae bacterium]